MHSMARPATEAATILRQLLKLLKWPPAQADYLQGYADGLEARRARR
jgi:hypothetical protein